MIKGYIKSYMCINTCILKYTKETYKRTYQISQNSVIKQRDIKKIRWDQNSTWKDATSLVIREMLVKTTMKYQYTCIRIDKTFTNWKYQMMLMHDAKKLEFTYINDGNVKWRINFWKKVCQIFIKLNIHLTYNPAVPFWIFS